LLALMDQEIAQANAVAAAGKKSSDKSTRRRSMFSLGTSKSQTTMPTTSAAPTTSPPLAPSAAALRRTINLGVASLSDPALLSDAIPTDASEHHKAWLKYWEQNGSGIDMLKRSSLLELVQGGIPNRERGRMWQLLSGSAYRLAMHPGYYHQVLNQYHGRQSRSLVELEKVC
jgi:hypothetical protein